MIDLKRFRKDFKIPQRENYELLDIEQLYLSAIENVTGKAKALAIITKLANDYADNIK